ncbi:MAG TPA: DUF4384 domain-containing protein [Rhodocyclaceae bacterium]|uniref:hypothetical protein n=1 Tax=Zoogloea sp. TaxID=49181 RepID=UPI002D0BF987|nr:hypothetical protein [Zoogloea sp.]HMW52627.1 DUF4384 domain-containing protein [Rhodocyclaceae bacterium]HNB65593.1 DUF4384 domain-containing protein [Rhodocyclaceae bacterium]HNH17969.1 DUF4384 domain-containing protein [Zoogloea sp.]
MPRPHRLTATALILALACAGFVPVRANPPPVPTASAGSEDEAMQPKFVWGILIKIAYNVASSVFSDWAKSKLSIDLSPGGLAKLFFNSSTARIVPVSLPSLGFLAKQADGVGNAVAGEPTAPLVVNAQGINYQGVHVALLGFDRAGKALGYRPVTDGFRSGERFKLRILPTFDGLLALDNINPQGRRAQVYPPERGTMVEVKAGVEILVPLDRDQYLEFAGSTGEEKLVVTLRSPRAVGDAASPATVYRHDEAIGSSFVQETRPGTYPVIVQALSLRHD